MFFIFGWNHGKVTEYGPVQEELCQNCHNTEAWQLKKISKYFTLFFIPIFAHDSQDLYHCPICNYGLTPDHEDFESYKAIAEVNTDCLEKRITEEERLVKLEEIHRLMQGRNEVNKIKDTEDSKNWTAVVAERSSEELQNILDKKRGDYNPAFIIAAISELEKRKGNG